MGVLRWIKGAISWGNAVWHVLGWFGLVPLVTGLAVAVGGAVWAIVIGVPLPIAIMAGFCALVGAVYLAMAPLAFKVLTKPQASNPEPDLAYDAWRLVPQMAVRDAAYLWVDIEPDNTNFVPPKVSAWIRALTIAIRDGELEFVLQPTEVAGKAEQQKRNADWSTFVTRTALQEYCKNKNLHPRFLRD